MAVEGWKEATLIDVCEILDSKRIPLNSDERNQRKGDIPYWGANGIVDYIDDHIFDEPLLLMAEDGGYFDQASTRPICHLIDGPAWVNNHAHVMRVKKGTLREWVYYWFVHRDITHYINGGTRTKLNQKDLRSLPIDLPPLPEQKKIAEILESVDDAIAKTESVIAQTQRVKQGLLQQLLTCGIGHTKFKQSPLGEIPESWCLMPLSEALELLKDGTHLPPKRVEEGPLLLSVQNMINETLRLTSKDTRVPWPFYEQMHKNWSIQPGDTLLACVGATIGKTAIAPNNFEPYTLQRSVAVLRGKKDVTLNSYIYAFVKSKIFFDQMWSRAKVGAQPGIYLKEIAKILIPVPSINEQENIVETFHAIQFSEDSSTQQLAALKNSKSGLMSDLLTGRVRVNVDAKTLNKIEEAA